MRITMIRRKYHQRAGSLGMATGILAFLLISLPIIVFPATGVAKDWPDKAITIIVPWAAGGGTDIVARSLAPKLSRTLGVPVQTVNKPGGSGIPGTLEAVSAAPDGYTLLWDCGGTSSMQYALAPELPYKVFDRTFIARATTTPEGLMVPASSPWKTMDDLVRAVRTDPSSVSFGMIGGTGIPDVLVYQLKAALKAKGVDVSKTRMVTYKGGGELVPAVAGAHVNVAFVSPGEMIAMLSAGKIRVLGVTSPSGKRYKGWPDVPTMAEAGFPTVDTYFWVGLGGAPGLPANIVKTLDNAVREAIREADQDPTVVAAFDKLGLSTGYLSGDQYKKFVLEEGERVKAVVSK
ncbi:MAG TPA: tripartite tricarboxylate transporter substrate binding protein [Candidatus Methylomirabilis sp.]|nr:tripartite tricarboxylate transporter substrate binding protein [Candidatus Methylomirabilis sp.]